MGDRSVTEPKISEAAKAKADELCAAEESQSLDPTYRAFVKFIQTTSDVAKEAVGYHNAGGYMPVSGIQSLILPDPKDPLDQVWDEFWPSSQHNKELFRQALADRGLQITPIEGE